MSILSKRASIEELEGAADCASLVAVDEGVAAGGTSVGAGDAG